MNSIDKNEYNPAEDENQGVITKLTHGEESGGGVAQADYMNPMKAQGPEPEKAEVSDSDTNSNGINADLLVEAEVEDGEVEIDTGNDE